MKVHPVPKKRNITFRYDISSTLSQANSLSCRQKKLRRLPHIFAKVLELPFHSDADVVIEETSDCLRFIVTTDDIGGGEDVGAHRIEIYPGVTKIVIRGGDDLDLSVDRLELDMWRFRLPALTRPELATAAYRDGELIVTVPKGDNPDEDENGDGDIGAGRRLSAAPTIASAIMSRAGESEMGLEKTAYLITDLRCQFRHGGGNVLLFNFTITDVNEQRFESVVARFAAPEQGAGSRWGTVGKL